MKANLKKKTIRYLLSVTILVVLFTPLYMYFSYDVAALKSSWPHRIGKTDPAFYEVREGKPSGWANLREISSFARWAIVLSEDWAFYQHEGIDVEQIKVALNEMMEEKRFRGASTITQQMVKNVYLSEEWTVWRKVHEIILARKWKRFLLRTGSLRST